MKLQAFADLSRILKEPMTIVAVEVANGRIFHCYLEVLRRCSSFFRACFDSGFEEAYTLTVRLEDPAWCSVFHLFSEWSLRREIRSLQSDTSYRRTINSVQNNAEVPLILKLSTWTELVNLWLLGDYLGAPKLQNDVIDALAERAHLTVSDESPFLIAQRVWNRTGPSSALRSFFRELLTNPNYFGSPGLYTQRLDFLSKEIAADLGDYIAPRLRCLYGTERSGPAAHHCDIDSPHILEETYQPISASEFYVPDFVEDGKGKNQHREAPSECHKEGGGDESTEYILEGPPPVHPPPNSPYLQPPTSPEPSQHVNTPNTSEPPGEDESASDSSAQNELISSEHASDSIMDWCDFLELMRGPGL